jgi:putative ABC transport system permease protein
MFMYRGFRENMADGPGYRTDHLLMMNFDTSLVRYTEPQTQQFFEQVAERARAVPGVTSVTMTTGVPMSNDAVRTVTIAPEGFQFPPGKENVTVLAAFVDEHYLDTLAIGLLQGRNFRRNDDADAPRVAVVNQHLAQHYWPNQDVIGKRFRVNDADHPWVEIVGVAKTTKYIFVAEAPSDFVYLPYRQRKPERMFLMAQSSGDPASLVGPLREVVRTLDVNLPIYNVRTMEELYRMRAISIFNVLITIVATRTTVLGMVLRQGLLLALVGLVVGLAGSIGAGQLLNAAFPSGDNRQDIMALVLVAPIVLVVTILAAYIPARRASRINPTEALRYE